MKTETKEKRNIIQWNILTQLDDLDFADDLALMSHSHRQMQDKTTYLARISAQVGLKINKKKTKILRLNTTCERPIMLEGEGLEEVESFRYLGSIVCNVMMLSCHHTYNTHLLNEVIYYQPLLSYIMRARRENPEA